MRVRIEEFIFKVPLHSRGRVATIGIGGKYTSQGSFLLSQSANSRHSVKFYEKHITGGRSPNFPLNNLTQGPK